jgi:hypothetical protein
MAFTVKQQIIVIPIFTYSQQIYKGEIIVEEHRLSQWTRGLEKNQINYSTSAASPALTILHFLSALLV